MKIFNLRFGFATNSSSTHSIVFFPDGHSIKDDYSRDGSFGLDNFTCASKEAKLHYLAQNIKSQVSHSMNTDDYSFEKTKEQELKQRAVASIIKEITTDEFNQEGYIDHQSEIGCPMNWDSSFIDLEFFEDMKRYFLQDNIVILGGNDDDYTQHWALKKPGGKIQDIPFGGSNSSVARKDKEHNYWTIFNRGTGNKIRFSFDNFANKPKKASAPELVDIKITDFCDKGCKFCYQNSTTDGAHAEISNLVKALKELKVFEVALGGGEPTLHPDFITILKDFNDNNIRVNFSTKSLDWLRDNSIWPKVMNKIGAFAYSVQSSRDIDNLNSLLVLNDLRRDYYSPASIQYVMGSTDPYEFEDIIKKVNNLNLRLTLLDFKEVGRGKNFGYNKYPDDWIRIIKKYIEKSHCSRIGIDTPLAKKYSKSLIEAGVSDFLFEENEGTFSMYIDAVTGKCGPSSYCNGKDMIDVARVQQTYNCKSLIWDASEIQETFTRF